MSKNDEESENKQATEETFKKETKKVRTKIMRDTVGFLIMIIFLIAVYIFRSRLSINFRLLLILGGSYLGYVTYQLYKRYRRYFSLTDELRLDGKDLLKYNPVQGKIKRRVPVENIKKVYYDIDEHPNTLYVVYNKKGQKGAENFYKNNLAEKEHIMDFFKKNELLVTEPISLQELKDKIEAD